MGVILEGTCPACAYHAKVLVEGGLRDCEPQTALNALPDDTALQNALSHGAAFRLQRTLASCTHCHELLAQVVVTYTGTNGRAMQSHSVCPTCGGELSPQRNKLNCPVCGQPMELCSTGLWD